jgi:hypothetical protein
VARIKEMTKNVGADPVLEWIGTKKSMMQALECARPDSMIGYVGVPHTVELDGQQLFFGQKGLLGGPAPVRRFLRHLMDLVLRRLSGCGDRRAPVPSEMETNATNDISTRRAARAWGNRRIRGALISGASAAWTHVCAPSGSHQRRKAAHVIDMGMRHDDMRQLLRPEATRFYRFQDFKVSTGNPRVDQQQAFGCLQKKAITWTFDTLDALCNFHQSRTLPPAVDKQRLEWMMFCR